MGERYHAFWVLTRSWFRLDRPLLWGEDLTVRTWHREGRGAIMYRDFDLLAGGQTVGEAVTAWVLMDLETGQMKRLSAVSELTGTGGGALCKSVLLSKLRMPGDLVPTERRLLRYSDTDINGHVNNTKYADFACDALHMEKRGAEEFIAQMRLGYLAQCWPGEELTLLTGAGADGLRLVRGEDGDHVPRFDAAVTVKKTLHVRDKS
jgi:acyl-ACP thioesterase